MNITKVAEKIMFMDEDTWARHSNPLSVYSRFSILPLLSIAFWSREWLGLYSLLPITLSLLWIWLNPRLFGVPKHTTNWASMGTFGERIYLNRNDNAIPEHHLKAAKILQFLSMLGLPIFIYGVYFLDFHALVLGNVWIMAFKAWFVDRMVWIYMDLKESKTVFQDWLR